MCVCVYVCMRVCVAKFTQHATKIHRNNQSGRPHLSHKYHTNSDVSPRSQCSYLGELTCEIYDVWSCSWDNGECQGVGLVWSYVLASKWKNLFVYFSSLNCLYVCASRRHLHAHVPALCTQDCPSSSHPYFIPPLSHMQPVARTINHHPHHHPHHHQIQRRKQYRCPYGSAYHRGSHHSRSFYHNYGCNNHGGNQHF